MFLFFNNIKFFVYLLALLVLLLTATPLRYAVRRIFLNKRHQRQDSIISFPLHDTQSKHNNNNIIIT